MTTESSPDESTSAEVAATITPASPPSIQSEAAFPLEPELGLPASPPRYEAPKTEALVDSKFEKKLSKYIERTEKDIEKLTERQALSGQEFDKQIVALAGGGLALSITLVKDFLNNKTDLLWLLFASWFAFLLALTANLVSHHISTQHYNLMIERQKHYLDCSEDENRDIDEALDARLGKRVNRRTRWVNGLNLGALITCLLGITCFVIFTFYNKYHENAPSRPEPPPAPARAHSRHYQGSHGNDGTTQPAPASPSPHKDSILYHAREQVTQ